MTMTFAKSRRAKSKDDFETWLESEVSNTINVFDIGGGDTQATTIVVTRDEESDNDGGETIL